MNTRTAKDAEEAMQTDEADNCAVVLSDRDFDKVLDSIDNPPRASQKAIEAARLFKKLYG